MSTEDNKMFNITQHLKESELEFLSANPKLFSEFYYAKNTELECAKDIEIFNSLINQNQQIAFNLYKVTGSQLCLKIYTYNNEIALSNIMPYLDNLGFFVQEEQSFNCTPAKGNGKIYKFNLQFALEKEINNFQEVKSNIEDALHKLFAKFLAPDSLNKLIFLSRFTWREVTILKALTRYLHQTGFVYGKGYVQLTLVKHYEFSKNLLDFFSARFNPLGASASQEKKFEKLLLNYLTLVTSNAEDTVLRSMHSIVSAVTRTNCYQKDSAKQEKTYVSFKFNSCKIPNLPLPLPYAEIFVFSNEFEGVHLRGGKVARGGIRWSDRSEDYRLEVLGLMKAQMTKNTVIVPVGSKGGFCVKFTKEDCNNCQTHYQQRVVASYQNFLRGILDITDNIIDETIVVPSGVIIKDSYDPYLVVAADKGTATFSDTANAISAEYNFWLGDAFASGGSDGYDHKKMGITARGAWIAAQRHFLEMQIDIQKESITVVGIGDMSGDVFGNGMLLSNKIMLLAAFNHKHIFLDPNPNPEVSFEERKRLFKLPRSSWSDYDHKNLSKGGAILDRSSKTVEISKEVMVKFGLSQKSYKPDELIKEILKCNIDLIWNGGIGTYVKASAESHLEIGDKTNDAVRVNASEVKAKVIAEGGNLGLSQRGRIEFAKLGGKINTDAVDNSAGVNCSDNEVNIKIALNLAMKDNLLTLKQRNQLLAKMTEQVAVNVLQENTKLTQAISIAQHTKLHTIEMYAKLITSLEEEKLLNRDVEFLPSISEMHQRAADKEFLTRPEISVLLAYSKMSAYKSLLNSKISNEKYFENDLLAYFPKEMQKSFRKQILDHPLRKEIITTVTTSKVINRIGPLVLQAAMKQTGARLCDIIRAYSVINEILNLDLLWKQIDEKIPIASFDTKVIIFSEINKLIRRAIFWLVKNTPSPISISDTIIFYKDPVNLYAKFLAKIVKGEDKKKYQDMRLNLKQQQIPSGIAETIVALEHMISGFDIVKCIKDSGFEANEENVIKFSKLYSEIGEHFAISWLRRTCDELVTDSYWNRISIQAIKDDFYFKQNRILKKMMLCYQNADEINYANWIKEKAKEVNIYLSLIDELRSADYIELPMIVVANKRLEVFLQKI